MVNSMTGFASRRGQGAGASWHWEMRGVNGKGLDLRLRLPDSIDALEPAVRTAVSGAVHRGSLTLSLKVVRDAATMISRINPEVLEESLRALREIEVAAATLGVTVTPARSSDILGLRGVVDSSAEDVDTAPLLAALLADLRDLIAEFNAMRAAEGKALAATIDRALTEISALIARAGAEAEARRDHSATNLRDNLARVMGGAPEADPDRVAQELALIAVKADVTEELDRLAAHVTAARELMQTDAPVGRKLDFLMQEFNREANTLCAKAQSVGLTRVGLDLKAVIDQMREQVQNVE